MRGGSRPWRSSWRCRWCDSRSYTWSRSGGSCRRGCWRGRGGWGRCGRWSQCRSRSRSAAALAGCLNFNRHWIPGLKEAYRRVGGLWRLVGIESEVIHRAPSNRVGILIGSKGLCVPCDRACVRGNLPWLAAIASVPEGAVVRPAWMLRRRVEINTANVSSSDWHAEGLDSTIQVHVKQSILIVPNSG